MPRLRAKPVSAAVAVTPAIDLFFLLLVFFMLSNSIVFWPGAKVDTQLRLPKARVNSMRVADKIIITVTQSGRLFFNDRDVEWEDLERRLREMVRESREASAAAGGTQTPAAAVEAAITITPDGQLVINDEDIAWDDLVPRLRELLRENLAATPARQGNTAGPARARAPIVVLRADRDIPYQQIIDVMSLARSLELGVYLVTDSHRTTPTRPAPGLGDNLE